MKYIENTLDRLNEILIQNGCGLYHPAMIEIGNILSDVIIGANLDSSLVDDALEWNNFYRDEIK